MTDAAIAAVVTGVVTVTTMVIGFLTLWVKLKYGVEKAEEAVSKTKAVERKIDDNTVITKAASVAALSNAKVAADNAIEAKEASEHISRQLNGNLEEKITAIVKTQIQPVTELLKVHSEQDDKNMSEIRQALKELKDRTRGNPK